MNSTIKDYGKQIAFQIRKRGYTTDQVNYLFKVARQKADLPPTKPKKAAVTTLTTDQLRRFLDTAIRTDQRIGGSPPGLMMRTLFEGALRIAEFCALECRDFDYQGHCLTVRHGKGDKQRRVVVSRHLADLLNLYIGDRRGAMFPSRLHKAYSHRAIQLMVKRIAREAGLEEFRIHPHLFRHTRATLLAEKGMPLPHLQHFLGHESVTTTEHYTRTAQYPFREKLNELEPYDPLGVLPEVVESTNS